MRKHGKVDGNQSEVVERFRAYGWSVQSLASIGGGCPDLLCKAPDGELLLVEVKMPREYLNDLQHGWALQWNGPVRIVRSVNDVDELAGRARIRAVLGGTR